MLKSTQITHYYSNMPTMMTFYFGGKANSSLTSGIYKSIGIMKQTFQFRILIISIYIFLGFMLSIHSYNFQPHSNECHDNCKKVLPR